MSTKSILVVEDDFDIRETLSALLEDRGYNVSTSANGLDALAHIRSQGRPDIILLDLMMPVMDGWQFRVAQKRDPEVAQIPVIAISANGTPKAAAIDADAYLQKPIDIDALLAAIERTLFAVERRSLQAALAESERLAALGTLAAGVAHEINNPLAYVLSNVSYAARVLSEDAPSSAEKSEARNALSEAEDGCARIRTIVRDLQLFARPAAEETRPLDVRRVLDSSVALAAHELRRHARVVKSYGDVPLVDANEGRLGQVFINLLINAAQAIPEGDVEKNEIRLVVRSDGGPDGAARWVVIEVCDTGAGIPPEIRARIFEPFFTTKPIGVGTGLGLSIVHKLVVAAKGEIEVESERGKGTTFRLRFPVALEEVTSAPSAPATPSGEEPRKPARRAHLLVVDDEENIGRMLERALQSTYDVETTTSPHDAVERVRSGGRFDLVLCDMTMPGKTGVEVHAAIAQIAPEQAARMLFLTGDSSDKRFHEFLLAQRRPFLHKPFRTSQLLGEIEAALSSFEPARDPSTASALAGHDSEPRSK
jgi:signal transduction histidine kinase